jgi:prolyl-tRNA synthetase
VKEDLAFGDLVEKVPAILEQIQSALFAKAKAGREEKTAVVTKWEDFVPAIDRGCMVLTPFCDEAEWEDKVKVIKCKCNVDCIHQ